MSRSRGAPSGVGGAYDRYGRWRRLLGASSDRLCARKDDGESRTMTEAVDEDEAAMRFDRALDDSEPEAAAAGLRGEERVEETIANFDRNARAHVADAKCDRARIEGDADGERVKRAGRDVNVHDAPIRRRLHGIEHE